jgi:uncharacterized protein YfdQ (DUF2303 family)
MSDTDQIVSEAGVGAALAIASMEVEHRLIVRDKAEGPNLVVLRDGEGAERIEEIVDKVGGVEIVAPGRIKTTLTLETVDSLGAYLNRFKTSSSTILAAISSDNIVGVLNYHASSRDDDPVPAAIFEADFLDHRATLKLQRSLEWQAWTGISGKMLPQLDLVRFIEENREDVLSPDAATILEACRDLQMLRKVDFRSVVREDSENYRIEYAEESDARPKGAVTMPSEIVLRLPVYFGDAEVDVNALIRWKIDDGKLTLGLVLKRAERIRQAQFQQVVAGLVETTGLQALYGSIANAN